MISAVKTRTNGISHENKIGHIDVFGTSSAGSWKTSANGIYVVARLHQRRIRATTTLTSNGRNNNNNRSLNDNNINSISNKQQQKRPTTATTAALLPVAATAAAIPSLQRTERIREERREENEEERDRERDREREREKPFWLKVPTATSRTIRSTSA